jgi:hypothetical protein
VLNQDPNQPDRYQSPGGPQFGQPVPAGSQGQASPNTLSSGVNVGTQAVPRQGFLTASFVWMFLGLLLSAASAGFVMTNQDALTRVMDYWIVLLIGQLGLVFALSILINRISSLVALGLFFAYALLNGLTIGVIVLVYVGTIGISGVVSAFLGSAAIFAGAAVYGGVTKRDLTSLGGILFMGLIGLIVVSFLQIFFFADNGTASFIIGIFGVLIFTGLTAWDVQRISQGRVPTLNRDSASVMGALALYLDFVNLFLFMLRIMGGSRS